MLYTYRCPNCQSVAITNLAPIAGHPERCKCRSWLRLLFTTPITERERELVKHGMVFNPYADPPKPLLCVRCGGEAGLMSSRLRPDGRVCADCYEAEAPPMTPEQNDAGFEQERLRSRQIEREDEARMEAAYAAQEKQ